MKSNSSFSSNETEKSDNNLSSQILYNIEKVEVQDTRAYSKHSPKFILSSFFFFGIACLCAWNSIVACLDFFNYFVIIIIIYFNSNSKVNIHLLSFIL